MKKYIIPSISAALGLMAIFATPPAFSQAMYAINLGVYPVCTGCHTSQDNPSKRNVMAGASWNHLAVSTPVCTNGQVLNTAQTACITPVPTCTGGQVLNAAKDACITPTPTCISPQVLNAAQTACITPTPNCVAPQVLDATQTTCITPTPSCVSPQVLNAAKDACITPTPSCVAPQVLNAAKDACVTPVTTTAPTCVLPQVLNAAKTACVTPSTTTTLTCVLPKVLNTAKTACVTPSSTKTNTKPVLNSVAQQWDIEAGQLLTIPLSVKDAEQDEFVITGSVAGSKFSKIYPNAGTLLPTIDFQWTPTAKQVNKIYTISFMAKETKTTQKFASNKVSVRIRVWPAGNRDVASVSKLNVATSVWKAGTLTLSGNVVFNPLMTPAERKAFIAKQLELTVTSGKSATGGELVGNKPLILDNKGNWSVSFPVAQAQAPCDITLQYEGQNASRTVTGVTCKTASTAVTTVATAGNNSSFGEHEENESEGEDDRHHGEGEHDD